MTNIQELNTEELTLVSGGYELTAADLAALGFDPSTGQVFNDPSPQEEEPSGFTGVTAPTPLGSIFIRRPRRSSDNT